MVAYHNATQPPRHVYELSQRELGLAVRMFLRLRVRPPIPQPPRGQTTFRINTRRDTEVEMVGNFTIIIQEEAP